MAPEVRSCRQEGYLTSSRCRKCVLELRQVAHNRVYRVPTGNVAVTRTVFILHYPGLAKHVTYVWVAIVRFLIGLDAKLNAANFGQYESRIAGGERGRCLVDRSD